MPSPVCVRFSDRELEILDKYAASRKVNRSNALREIVMSKALDHMKDDTWMVKAFNIFNITASQLRFAISQKSQAMMLGYIAEKCKDMTVMAMGEYIVVSIARNEQKYAARVVASMSNVDALEHICVDIEKQMVKAFMGA